MIKLDAVHQKFLAGMSLLIVDDGILHHTVVQKACEKLQLSFAGAETEKAALALYEAGRRFDIVLMDIHIGADTLGYDVARKILELDPTALIISFSSDSIEIRREKGGKIMVGHLEKNGAASYLCPELYRILQLISRM